MSNVIIAQCPNCLAQYRIDPSKITQGNQQARCAKCQTKFDLLDNVLSDTQQPPNTTSPSTDAGSAVNNITASSVATSTTSNVTANHVTSSQAISQDEHVAPDFDDGMIHDDMIHDDMDTDFDEANSEQETAWDDFDASVFNEPLQTQDTQAQPAEQEEGSWLEALLDGKLSDDNEDDDEYEDDNTDLSSLLDDVGVETVDTSVVIPTEDEHAVGSTAAPNALHKKQSSKPKKSVIAPLLWTLGCAFLLLSLLAQYVIFNLDNLVKQPEYQTKLQAFCGMANCSLPNADISQIIISNQTLRPSKTQAGKTDIMAAMINQSESDQLYPNLKVSLYDANGLIGDFVAEPKDYLVTPQRLISSSQATLFMFSVNADASTISKVVIVPFY